MSADLRDIRPSTGLFMGALFLLAGLMILFVALGWIMVDPETIHAPRWVLGILGGVFGLTGVAILYYGLINAMGVEDPTGREGADEKFSVVGWLLGLVIAGGMATVASWVAFGPGERAFSGSVGVGGLAIGGSAQSETLGRLVFGFGAVLAAAFTVWGLVYGLRKLSGSHPRDDR